MPRLPLLVALLFGLALSAAQAQSPARQRPDVAEVNRQIVDETNRFRGSHGAGPTAPNARLSEAAHRFAEYMARTDRYGHDADGSQPPQRAKAQGYAHCLLSENIANAFNSAGFRTPDLARRIVDGWKESPRHRQNMLDPDVTETGVAVVQSPKSGRYYAVQMFGRPQSQRIEFKIANRSTTPLRYELGGAWYALPPRVTRTHEQCRAETLSMRLPGDERPTTIQPAAGERYAVERVGARLRLSKG